MDRYLKIDLKIYLKIKNLLIFGIIATLFIITACTDKKQTINIAVASNFEGTLKLIIQKYQITHKDAEINIISASSGILTTQILNSAPFDLFLSADTDKPQKIFKQLKLEQPPQIYAIGKLALWIPGSSGSNCLTQLADIKTLVIANPKTAPYGKVAQAILATNNIQVEKLIQTSNASQAYIYTKDGLTNAGFVPYSMIAKDIKSCMQLFDNKDLSQGMILLKTKAEGFYEFILSSETQALIQNSGYNITPM
ncbi:Molybdenum ABC transporter, substrate-binding protein ModA [hydrothermal vent metagenome]|uniref:Molybdenum ABC transporter, substrate-binding protein ModA n=1 Tax=hydrothermal vent metagenome TaxID=652676 RepID=A0A3B0VFR6_9ZZZZ